MSRLLWWKEALEWLDQQEADVRSEAIRRMEAFDCTKCGAAPGEHCHKPSGTATIPHRIRYERAVNSGMLPLRDGEPL